MIDTHQELLIALSEASELEHSLICQYLFAAYSIKDDPAHDNVAQNDADKFANWREQILDVARQEMGHLGTVWNLCALIGGAPHIERANFPQPSTRYYPPHIDFALTRFSLATLDRFIDFERPEDNRLEVVVKPPDPLVYKRVGDLYRQIRAALTALSDGDLLINPSAVEDQGSWSNNVILHTAQTRQEALAAVDFIILQGEGAPGARAGSHFVAFSDLKSALKTHLDAGGADPARNVVENPAISPHRDVSDTNMITAPLAVQAIAVFNLLYSCLLAGLQHYYAGGAETPAQHNALKMACYKLMHGCIGPLAGLLTQLPTDRDGLFAAPTFELYGPDALSATPRAVWNILNLRLSLCKTELGTLAADVGNPKYSSISSFVQQALDWLQSDVPA